MTDLEFFTRHVALAGILVGLFILLQHIKSPTMLNGTFSYIDLTSKRIEKDNSLASPEPSLGYLTRYQEDEETTYQKYYTVLIILILYQ